MSEDEYVEILCDKCGTDVVEISSAVVARAENGGALVFHSWCWEGET